MAQNAGTDEAGDAPVPAAEGVVIDDRASAIFPVPTTGTNSLPVALAALPAGATAVRFYLGPGQSVSYTFAATAAAAATAFSSSGSSTATNTLGSGGDLLVTDDVAASLPIFVGAVTGTPRARYL